MGQKVNPIANRLGVIRGWESNWFGGKDFSSKLVEDTKIRKYLNARLAKASISKIIIERTLKLVTVTISTARPGIIIGKGGQEVDKLKEELKKLTGKEVQINIFEVKRPEVDAVIVANNIARQLEGRVSYRRAIKTAIASTMRMGAEGIKIQIAGRVGGAEMARNETYKEGRVPLHTFRADAQSIRNFSCCYSKGKIHPIWVAAPMHSSYLGNSGRNNSYRDDPNIKCPQASKFEGYTRGHMVGSSDRTVSVATNKQAFYHSNIGAQMSSGFNTGGGAWNNLESVVDGLLCPDTLYQVIGVVFQTWTDNYGHTTSAKTGTSSDGTFQVPTGWYKVLLRTKKGNTGKRVDECSRSELQCVAFMLGHYSNKGHQPSEKDMFTVSEIEEMTGLTFFPNVPNAPKDEFNASDWL